jgi:hypothetical protein
LLSFVVGVARLRVRSATPTMARIHLDEPELVIDAIKQVITAVKTGKALKDQ